MWRSWSKKQKKGSLCAQTSKTRCLYSFSCCQSFFRCYFICRTKARKNILVISQKKKPKKQKKRLTVCPNDARHVVFAHFHVTDLFFVVISYLGLKLVISQKKPKKQKKKAHYVPKRHETRHLYLFSRCQSFFSLLFHM